jgi:hypothetical protein
MAAGVPMPIT